MKSTFTYPVLWLTLYVCDGWQLVHASCRLSTCVGCDADHIALSYRFPVAGRGTLPNFGFGPRRDQEHFAFVYAGYLEVPATGVYTFTTESDDGSRLFIDGELVVDNDGLHGALRRMGVAALSSGLHPIRVEYFEKTGGDALTVSWEGPGFARRPLPDNALFRDH